MELSPMRRGQPRFVRPKSRTNGRGAAARSRAGHHTTESAASVGSSGCSCRLLPRSRGLPQMAGESASALSLSTLRLTLRPAGSLSRPQATFVRRLQPVQLHKNYASLTNDMCPRFNLSADFVIIEELAKERRADLDDARRQPAKAAGADPPVR